jgi:hypothetical protein
MRLEPANVKRHSSNPGPLGPQKSPGAGGEGPRTPKNRQKVGIMDKAVLRQNVRLAPARALGPRKNRRRFSLLPYTLA